MTYVLHVVGAQPADSAENRSDFEAAIEEQVRSFVASLPGVESARADFSMIGSGVDLLADRGQTEFQPGDKQPATPAAPSDAGGEPTGEGNASSGGEVTTEVSSTGVDVGTGEPGTAAEGGEAVSPTEPPAA